MWVQLAGIAATGSVWGAAAVRAHRRADPGTVAPADPRQLPSALADLALREGRVTRSAIEAGLRDLERDGWIGRVTHEDGSLSVYPRAPGERISHRLYQGLLLERLRLLRGERLSVPVAALGPEGGNGFREWWDRYRRAVQREAMAAGLLLPVHPRRRLLLAGARYAVALAVLWGVGAVVREPAVGVGLAVAVHLGLRTLGRRICAPRLSGEGERAAAWWRSAEGARSEAAAVELGPDQAWSGVGGRWRVVAAPGEPLRPAGGRPRSLAAAVLVVGLAALVLPVGARGSFAGALPLLFAALFLLAWLPRFVRRLRLPAYGSLAGEVVRCLSWTEDSASGVAEHRLVVVDDGTAAVAPAFEVDRGLWGQVRVGTRVRVEYNARSGKVRGVWLT